jgi:hypothetical protein
VSGDRVVDPAMILDLARAVLDGRHVVHGPHSARMAALLARQALEGAVGILCGPTMRRATMRSRLLYLRVLIDPETADCAGIAWNGLSGACHHHAYELSPTPGEVRHLMELVSVITVESM